MNLLLFFWLSFLTLREIKCNATYDSIISELKYNCILSNEDLCVTNNEKLVSCSNRIDNAIYADHQTNVFPIAKTFLFGNAFQESSDFATVRGCYAHWNPFMPPLAKVDMDEDTSEKIEFAKCMVMGADDCEECMLGYHRSILQGDGNDAVSHACQKQEDMVLHPNFSLVFVRYGLKPCEEGYYRTDLQGECDGRCPDNCLSCDSDETCNYCSQSTVISSGSSACTRWQVCPKRYYWDNTRCIPCSAITPFCTDCDMNTGQCFQCEANRIPIRTELGISCVLFCPRTFYYDLKNNVCRKCALACESCDGPNKCHECSTTTFSLLKSSGYYDCYMQCPFGYFNTERAPFRCLQCHKSCFGCHGPTSFDCNQCRTYGILTRKSLLAECSSYFVKEPLSFNPKPIDWLDRVKSNLFRMQARAETGFEVPLPGDTSFNYEPGRGVEVFSSYFESFEDAVKKLKLENEERPSVKFSPGCPNDTCVKNCEPRNAFSPCPACVARFYRDLDSSCTQKCLEGFLPSNTSGRCELGSMGELCKKYHWQNESNAYIPYRLYKTDQNLAEDSILVIESHICREKAYTLHCLDKFQFQSGDLCLMCHSECDHCTAYGSNYCVKCKNYLDGNGHCIRQCPYDMVAVEVNGIKTCQPPLIQEDAGSDRLSKDGYYGAWIAVAFCALLLFQLLLAMLIMWLFMPPLEHCTEIIHFRYEKKIAARALMMMSNKSYHPRKKATELANPTGTLVEFAAAALETGKTLERTVTSFRNLRRGSGMKGGKEIFTTLKTKSGFFISLRIQAVSKSDLDRRKSFTKIDEKKKTIDMMIIARQSKSKSEVEEI